MFCEGFQYIYPQKKYLQTYLMFLTLLANCGKSTVNELKVVHHNIRGWKIFSRREQVLKKSTIGMWPITRNVYCHKKTMIYLDWIIWCWNETTTPSSNNMILLQVVFVCSSSISAPDNPFGILKLFFACKLFSICHARGTCMRHDQRAQSVNITFWRIVPP